MKCYHNHKPLEIKHKGKTFTVFGGSGYAPAVKCDVYVDLNPRKGIRTQQVYPTGDGADYYNLPIVNMSVPNIHRLEEGLDFAIAALKSGRSLHVGCIGGHGRTGLFLAALVYKLTGDTDAVATVRANYCEKAVESKQQMDYLNHHYGIKKVKPRYQINETNWVTDL